MGHKYISEQISATTTRSAVKWRHYILAVPATSVRLALWVLERRMGQWGDADFVALPEPSPPTDE